MAMAKKDSSPRPLPALDLGHEKAEAFLKSCLKRHLPSLIFAGPGGCGKEYTAIEFGRKICCSNDPPCRPDGGLCPSCAKAVLLEHPAIDITYPTPSAGRAESEGDDVTDLAKILEEKRSDIFSSYRFSKKVSIRIARARAIIRKAYTKPFDSPFNVFIIVDAHTMREEAQNSLLKLVEEPPSTSILVFVTTNPEAILPTIRSRCQIVRFQPLDASRLASILIGYYGVDEQEARRAASLSRGDIRRAVELATTSKSLEREQARELVIGVREKDEAWLLGRALVLARGANRDRTAQLLQEVETCLRDIMAGEEELLLDVEEGKELLAHAYGYDRKKLPELISRVADARDRILRRNMNIDGTLAKLFLDMKRYG